MELSRLGAHGSSAREGLLLGEDYNPWKDRLLSSSILYIGNLPADCSREELLSYLSRFDRVVWAKISRDDSSSPGYYYAHAILKSVGGYERLLTYPVHTLRQMKLRVKMNGASPVFAKYEAMVNLRKVFVKRLSRTMTCEKLRQHFSRFGTVEDVDIPVNREDNSSRRIAFVTFREEEDAERCAQEKKQKIGGVEVICKRYKPPEVSSVQEESHGQQNTAPALAAQATGCGQAGDELLGAGCQGRATGAPQRSARLPVPASREMCSRGSLGVEGDCLAFMQTRYPSELSTVGKTGAATAKWSQSGGFSMDDYAQRSHQVHKMHLQTQDSCRSAYPGRWCSQGDSHPPMQAQSRVGAPEAFGQTLSSRNAGLQERTAVVFFKASGFKRITQSSSD